MFWSFGLGNGRGTHSLTRSKIDVETTSETPRMTGAPCKEGVVGSDTDQSTYSR
jgi:hypothetical protein